MSKVLRKCNRCDLEATTEKELELFVKEASRPYGRQTICKSCANTSADKEYQKIYRKVNKEKLKAQNKRYREVNKVTIAEQAKQYHTENKEVLNAYSREYCPKHYANNKELYKENHKAWEEKNKSKRREYNRRRRAYKLDSQEDFSKEDEVFTYELFDNKCFNCGTEELLELDHTNPLSEGFPLTTFNCTILCRSCNAKKANKMPRDFYAKWQIVELEGMYQQIIEDKD